MEVAEKDAIAAGHLLFTTPRIMAHGVMLDGDGHNGRKQREVVSTSGQRGPGCELIRPCSACPER